MRHLKWGLMGAGRIAGSFARGLARTEHATALAIGSRSLEKAQRFAEEHGIERAYGSYEDLLSDPDVDAVYIALPNHLHAEWSIKSAQAGKHILCEKPVTLNAAELEDVLAVVKASDVFFMEAFMYRCHPQLQRLREILNSGVIGEVRVIYSTFSFNMGPAYDNVRMVNYMGGGGLMDVGCYCVSLSRWIVQEEPVACRAVAHIGPRSRVDEYMAGALKFPGGALAYFTSGLQCSVPTTAAIYGSEGSIAIPRPWGSREGPATLTVTTGHETRTYEVCFDLDAYEAEALHVAEHLDARQAPAMTWDDSRGQMRALDALRADMGLVFDGEKGA